MSEVDYERLKSNTGIDFEGLRQKYKSIKTNGEVNAGFDEEEKKRRREEKKEADRHREENEDAMKKLNGYKICNTCNGQGIIKETYNFYQIDKTCPECDGESVMSIDLKTLLEP
jgi:DnaJ-class molecular chaperone